MVARRCEVRGVQALRAYYFQSSGEWACGHVGFACTVSTQSSVVSEFEVQFELLRMVKFEAPAVSVKAFEAGMSPAAKWISIDCTGFDPFTVPNCRPLEILRIRLVIVSPTKRF